MEALQDEQVAGTVCTQRASCTSCGDRRSRQTPCRSATSAITAVHAFSIEGWCASKDRRGDEPASAVRPPPQLLSLGQEMEESDSSQPPTTLICPMSKACQTVILPMSPCLAHKRTKCVASTMTPSPPSVCNVSWSTNATPSVLYGGGRGPNGVRHKPQAALWSSRSLWRLRHRTGNQCANAHLKTHTHTRT